MAARNRMEKVQSFTVNGGVALFNHGASKSRFYLSAYNLAGDLQTAYEMDKPGFAEAINKGAPGTVANPASYRHESEGAWTHNGKTWTGHIVDDNSTNYKFVIVEHNNMDGVQVEPRPVALSHDTDWVDIPLSAPIAAYTDASIPQIRRIGNVAYADGAVKGLTGSPDNVVVANVKDYAPRRQIELPLQKGALTHNTSWKIRPNGDLVVEKTTIPSPSASTWFPFQFNWPVGDRKSVV